MRVLAAINDPEVARVPRSTRACAPALTRASAIALGPETDFADQEQSWEFDQTPRTEDSTE
jgi:hypothetical protein